MGVWGPLFRGLFPKKNRFFWMPSLSTQCSAWQEIPIHSTVKSEIYLDEIRFKFKIDISIECAWDWALCMQQAGRDSINSMKGIRVAFIRCALLLHFPL